MVCVCFLGVLPPWLLRTRHPASTAFTLVVCLFIHALLWKHEAAWQGMTKGLMTTRQQR